MSDKILDSFVKFLSKTSNIGVLTAIFMTSLFLLLGRIFLPKEIMVNLSMDLFYDQYVPIVVIVFFVSFFLLTAQLFPMLHKKIKAKMKARELKKIHKELFEDPDCKVFLIKLYQGKNDPVLLPDYNQKVLMLRQSGMIIRLSNQTIGRVSDLHNPMLPYVLQTFTEEMIKKELKE